MLGLSRRFMAALAGGALVWTAWALLHPFIPETGAAATGLFVASFLFGLHKVAQWAERRGWIYYQERQGSWGAVGAAISEVHAIYRPGLRHVRHVQEDAHVHEEDDDQGDGPTPGGPIP